jgi:exosome complex component RRP45
MRETVLSNCEKAFVDAAVLENLRVDKRQLSEFRDIGLIFGDSFGSVICSLGSTRCFAQVSCEVSTPKASRPNEGTLFINVEVGAQNSEAAIQINRILERTLRESRCVDLEALCIIAEEKVWNLRVDISVLNQEGNVLGELTLKSIENLR